MLKINVGLNKKASKDYQSTGLSINLEAELDSGLLARPAELQAQIDGLYAQAQDALERQAATQPATPSRPAPALRTMPAPARGPAARPVAPAGGHARPPARPTAPAGGPTTSQLKAIGAISRQLDVDPASVAADLGLNFDGMTVKQASQLIDALKSMQAPAHTGR